MFNTGMTGILPVMNVDGNNDGWGNGGGWWAWILILALFGWGGNGFGWGANRNGNGCCCNNGQVEASIQRGFDNQTVVNKLNGLENGICSLGYDQLNQMNGINNTVQQTGWNLQQTMNQNALAQMQRDFAAQQQASDCCCENRVGQMNIINQMDRNTCAMTNTMNVNTRDIIDSYNNGMRSISDQINAGFTNLRIQGLEQENRRLESALNRCDRDSALLALGNSIVDRVSPCSRPAYLTCNPNTGNVFPQSGMDQWQVYNERYGRGGCCQTQCDPCCNRGF